MLLLCSSERKLYIYAIALFLYNEMRIKKKSVRNGWDEAFARYAKEGEDEMIIPDFVDNEAEMLL